MDEDKLSVQSSVQSGKEIIAALDKARLAEIAAFNSPPQRVK